MKLIKRCWDCLGNERNHRAMIGILTLGILLAAVIFGYLGLLKVKEIKMSLDKLKVGGLEIGDTNNPGCLMIRDSDSAGWSYWTALDGIMYASNESCE